MNLQKRIENLEQHDKSSDESPIEHCIIGFHEFKTDAELEAIKAYRSEKYGVTHFYIVPGFANTEEEGDEIPH
jgi:hypothetical protein